jgi:hypothetical protein
LTWEKDDYMEGLVSFLILAMLFVNLLSIGVTMPTIILMMTIESPTIFRDLIRSFLSMRMSCNKAHASTWLLVAYPKPIYVKLYDFP